MLFRIRSRDDVVLHDLRAAIAAHRPAAVSALLAKHGEVHFVKALQALSIRARDDALSMLTAPECVRLRALLPYVARFVTRPAVCLPYPAIGLAPHLTYRMAQRTRITPPNVNPATKDCAS